MLLDYFNLEWRGNYILVQELHLNRLNAMNDNTNFFFLIFYTLIMYVLLIILVANSCYWNFQFQLLLSGITKWVRFIREYILYLKMILSWDFITFIQIDNIIWHHNIHIFKIYLLTIMWSEHLKITNFTNCTLPK